MATEQETGLFGKEPKAVKVLDRAMTLPQEVKALQVTDQQSLDSASSFLTHVIMPLEKEVVSTFEPIKRKTRAAWQEAIDQEKRHLEPIQTAKATLKGMMATYMAEQERKRQEEQHRLEAEAEAKAFAEQQERIELEKQLGATEQEIEEIAAEPIVVEPVAPIARTEASTVGMRKVRKAKVVNKIAFIQHVSQHPDLQYLLDVNMPFLNSLAKTETDFPGIEFYTETIVAAKRGL